MVAREFPEVRLLRRGNIGFSAANNLVLRESEAAAVLLLNPDTEVYAGTLDAALARLRCRAADRHGRGQAGDRVGRARPRLQALLPDPARRPRPLHRDRPRRGRRRRAQPVPGDRTSATTSRARSTRSTAPSCSAGPRRSREVGLLDEGYWLYMEDLDWCHRFWDAGWKVFYEPAGVALHVKGGSSAGRRAPRQEIAFHRGMGRFYRRFDAAAAQPAAERRGLRRDRRQTRRQPGDTGAAPRP